MSTVYDIPVLPVSFRRIGMKGEGKALQGWRIFLPKIGALASQLLFQPTKQRSRDLWASLYKEPWINGEGGTARQFFVWSLIFANF
jgi:hypothetical protein